MKSQGDALENGHSEIVDSAVNGSREVQQNATTPDLDPGSCAPNPKRHPAIHKGDRRVSHGAFAFLVNGLFPAKYKQTERNVGAFRRALELAVVKRCGQLDMYHAALCQSATRHEARAQLLTRWIATEKALKIETKLSVMREIGCASDCRDRCLKALGLDAQAANFWQEQSTPAA